MGYNTLALAHALIRRYVKPGAHCIDATAGRGRDTALLCACAGTEGKVWAFDIQPEAIDQTHALLAQNGQTAQVILDSHANMERYVPPASIDCIVFNFGRLPGGDPNIVTTAQTSITAIEAGLRLLKPGGVMSLSLYYGGANGYGERDAILDYLRILDDKKYAILVGDWVNRKHDPPIPIVIWKEATAN